MTGCGSPAHSVYELDGANHLDGVLGGDQELWPGFVLPWIGCHANIGCHHLSLCKNLSHLKRRRPETCVLESFFGIGHANERVGLANGNDGLTARVDLLRMQS